METIGYLLAGLTITWLWDTKVRWFLFTEESNLGYIHRNKLCRWFNTTKPFNCATCISFWIGLILSIIFCNPIYISLPLAYYFLNKTL